MGNYFALIYSGFWFIYIYISPGLLCLIAPALRYGHVWCLHVGHRWYGGFLLINFASQLLPAIAPLVVLFCSLLVHRFSVEFRATDQDCEGCSRENWSLMETEDGGDSKLKMALLDYDVEQIGRGAFEAVFLVLYKNEIKSNMVWPWFVLPPHVLSVVRVAVSGYVMETMNHTLERMAVIEGKMKSYSKNLPLLLISTASLEILPMASSTSMVYGSEKHAKEF